MKFVECCNICSTEYNPFLNNDPYESFILPSGDVTKCYKEKVTATSESEITLYLEIIQLQDCQQDNEIVFILKIPLVGQCSSIHICRLFPIPI